MAMFFVMFGLSGCDLFGGNTTEITSTTITTVTTTTVTTTEEPSELTLQLMAIYNLAVEADAFEGTYEQWLETVRGPQGIPGESGREVILQVASGYIQWKYVGDATWTNLVSLTSLTGANGIDGKEVTFQVSDGYIQWQYLGDTTWNNLIELSTLVGPAGQDGIDGKDGKEVTFQVSDGNIQ